MYKKETTVIAKRASKLQEMVENEEVPPLALACQSEMIRFVQQEFNLSGSSAWRVVDKWKNENDFYLHKNMIV